MIVSHHSRRASLFRHRDEKPVSSSPLEATLTGMLISVDCKELTEQLNLLDATLTENRGRGPQSFHPRIFLSLRSARPISFRLIFFQTLLHSRKTQPFSFQENPSSFAKNTGSGGTSFKPSCPPSRRSSEAPMKIVCANPEPALRCKHFPPLGGVHATAN